jgi:nucleoside-diphosphate-sugar epimerase
MRVTILGCGYSGERLLGRLVARGDQVRATTTTPSRRDALAALGAEALLLDLDDPDAPLAAAIGDAEAVVLLAPPSPRAPVEDVAARLAAAAGPALQALVYGSTTGAFGAPPSPDAWIDETTAPGPLAARGARRAAAEAALLATGLPLRVLRIAGIYGPGRTLVGPLASGELLLFHGGPPTSRVHVDDLARLLEALLRPDAPRLVIACDEAPAPTLEVARFTANLTGQPLPRILSLDEARARLSPASIEMRLGGRRCRSLERARLIGPLLHPTFREGVRASLAAEGWPLR